MRKFKKLLFVLLTVTLLMPTFFVTADTKDSNQENTNMEQLGKIATKDEVVYGKLSANGEQKEVYIVNVFDIKKAGKIFDYGTYTSVKNLTNLQTIERNGNIIEFSAQEGKFYYQGNFNDSPLPWNIAITYFLDGKEISPNELAGKSGHVRIAMETTANSKINQTFFENYLLQISLTLDPEIYTNIKAPDAMVANAGKNKQINFTVMPETDGNYYVEADVTEFELDGIDISAVPSSMAIDTPDLDEVTEEMVSLTNAIEQINNGVAQLKSGVNELNSGTTKLKDGSKKYRDGITTVSNSSAKLVDGSKEIETALTLISDTLNKNLANIENIDLSEVGNLFEWLQQLLDKLHQTAESLEKFQETYTNAYNDLNSSMQAISSNEISSTDIDKLYNSGVSKDVIDQLLKTYEAASLAKSTYSQLKDGLSIVNTTVENIIKVLQDIATNLETIVTKYQSTLAKLDVSQSLSLLTDGIHMMATNYQTFHSGLVDYTNGVHQLATNYVDLHRGIEQLSEGTVELNVGVGGLYKGTSKLHNATKNLPDQLKEEVNKMISEYDKSDFQPVSFVSEKNEKVKNVQFVLKTDSIKYDRPKAAEKPIKKEKSFWVKLLDLFRF
ncbi:hypothetical protein [Bacillus kwashiorkori]|uniref:hypothetical protein n=1 Tax=Bacillus kwashiorkori TaxID=1522318 RepID=UPI000781EE18|nr:hypothetical protein [Bacillus kwashiorkori]